MKTALSLYANTLRWHGPDKQAEHLKDPSSIPSYKGVKVVNYEVIQEPKPFADHVISQVARIQYVYEDTQVIKSIDDRQLWESDEEGTRWLRANPPPPLPR